MKGRNRGKIEAKPKCPQCKSNEDVQKREHQTTFTRVVFAKFSDKHFCTKCKLGF